MNDDDATVVEFRLYVAGDVLYSRRAVANLNALCRKYLPDRHRIEVVDVFEHPKRALKDGIFLTPQLVVVSGVPLLTIVGDLTDPSEVLRALGVEGDAP